MTLIEIIFIGSGLAMDAVAVSITNCMVFRDLKVKSYIAMILFFGVFQALMPLIGYYAGGIFAEMISKYSGIVILLILGVIGCKMIKEGLAHIKKKKELFNDGIVSSCMQASEKTLTFTTLFFQAIATSIDAFAVGIGFSAMRVDIIPAVIIIAIITFCLVAAAIAVSRKFGDILGCRAELVGGIILVIIGIKAIL